MSGFVYKVSVNNQCMIKKEIPSQETIEEFLYEINALNSLRFSKEVVQLHGIVVDDCDEKVKGLLIGYAEQGALVDILYDSYKVSKLGVPWHKRQKWARQIVQGLADVHESGFVQGDFTLSNIVVDEMDNAKVIDINRRGCPLGWEPPELAAMINAHQGISLYIGEKSDLFQLGMVLWALAVQEDEPEALGRPLMLGPEVNVPDWYRRITEICLSPEPRMRVHASMLLQMFPKEIEDIQASVVYIDDSVSMSDQGSYYRPSPAMLGHSSDQSRGPTYLSGTHTYNSPDMYEPYFPPRGRSPPSPLPATLDVCESPVMRPSSTSWAANRSVRPTYSDYTEDESIARGRSRTPVSEHRFAPAPWVTPYEAVAPLHRQVPTLSRHPTAIRHLVAPENGATSEVSDAGPNADLHTDSGTPTAPQSETDGGVSLQLKKINGARGLTTLKENGDGNEYMTLSKKGAKNISGTAIESTFVKDDELPRHAWLPMYLAGVGAGIVTDDEAIRTKGNMADEFNALSQTASAEGLAVAAEMN